MSDPAKRTDDDGVPPMRARTKALIALTILLVVALVTLHLTGVIGASAHG